MLSRLGAGNDVLRMHSTWRQHGNRVDILASEKIVDVIAGRNAKLRRDGIGPRPNLIAAGNQAGPLDLAAAEQIGMALGDAPATEQAKSDHRDFLCLPSTGREDFRDGPSRIPGSAARRGTYALYLGKTVSLHQRHDQDSARQFCRALCRVVEAARSRE